LFIFYRFFKILGVAILEREIKEIGRHQLTPLTIPSPTSSAEYSSHFGSGELFPATNNSGLFSNNASSQHQV
jgi:hypothetical protein